MSGVAYKGITAPTLAIAAEEHIITDDGHILIGREAEMTALVDNFLREIGFAPAA